MLKNTGKKLRNIRKYYGMSQKDFGSKIGIQAPYLSDLENGKKDLGTKTITSLKGVFNISSDWLLFSNSEIYPYDENNKQGKTKNKSIFNPYSLINREKERLFYNYDKILELARIITTLTSDKQIFNIEDLNEIQVAKSKINSKYNQYGKFFENKENKENPLEFSIDNSKLSISEAIEFLKEIEQQNKFFQRQINVFTILIKSLINDLIERNNTLETKLKSLTFNNLDNTIDFDAIDAI